MEHVDQPADVLNHIAHYDTKNVRVQEAANNPNLALATLNRCPVTAELATRAIAAFVQEGRRANISLMAIRAAVCRHFNISEADLVSSRRDRSTSQARQVAMYLMRELSRNSLIEIGGMFGGKSHSTVLYACDKLEKELREDKALEGAVRSIRGQLAARPE
jgi:chromosomal replication initiator protein